MVLTAGSLLRSNILVHIGIPSVYGDLGIRRSLAVKYIASGKVIKRLGCPKSCAIF